MQIKSDSSINASILPRTECKNEYSQFQKKKWGNYMKKYSINKNLAFISNFLSLLFTKMFLRMLKNDQFLETLCCYNSPYSEDKK